MTTDREHLIRSFDRMIDTGLRARARFAKRVEENGVADAMEWSNQYLRDDQVGRVAANFKPALVDEAKPLSELVEILTGRISKETGFISLGNTQMDVTSKISYVQAMQSVLELVESFLEYQKKNG